MTSPAKPLPCASPSDLTDAADRSVVVEGRCLGASNDRIQLSDALAQIEVRWSEPLPQPPPLLSMVRIAGELVDGVVIAAQVLEVRPCGGRPDETTRMRDHGVARRLVERARLLARVRRFFNARGYLEVETPTMVPSPGLDLHLDAYAIADDTTFLITSPEYQMKRLLAGGLPRIFQVARCFRRGEQGARHNPEFTMLEWYRAGARASDMMDETEALVRDLLPDTHGDQARILGGRCDWRAPFVRLSVAEAFERYAQIDCDTMLRLAGEDEDTFFRLLVERVEPSIAALGVPAFLYDYPAPQASLARLRPDDRRFAERFELYVGDLELCNGFGELIDPVEQRGRLERDHAARAALERTSYPIDERFLAALEEGLPRCAGNAVGLDRLFALALGCASIGEVMALPQDRL
jgi:elongation factor P--(R)-beta-lysine ligase